MSAAPLTARRPRSVLAGAAALALLSMALLGTSPAAAQTVTAVDDLVGRLQAEQVVVADDADVPLDVDAAREHCRSVLTAYKVPRRVVVADDLPRSQIGKVLRRQVRDQLLAD